MFRYIITTAPYVFEMAWGLIKPFVSDYTRSKLRFLGSNQKQISMELLKHMEIDQFPSSYGGTSDEYGTEEKGRS